MFMYQNVYIKIGFTSVRLSVCEILRGQQSTSIKCYNALPTVQKSSDPGKEDMDKYIDSLDQKCDEIVHYLHANNA